MNQEAATPVGANGGRKFYLLKTGVMKTFWFTLVATFTAETINRVITTIAGIDAVDLSMMWGFLRTYMFVAVIGMLAYCGVNMVQHLGFLKFNGGEKK